MRLWGSGRVPCPGYPAQRALRQSDTPTLAVQDLLEESHARMIDTFSKAGYTRLQGSSGGMVAPFVDPACLPTEAHPARVSWIIMDVEEAPCLI